MGVWEYGSMGVWEYGSMGEKMNIKPDDYVLEIGSGHNPKTRADVLCDKFIYDDLQRGGKIVTDRPIVAADGQYLPFTDKSFDYVICSHVLEHVEDAELFLKELMRVADRGYIETPSEIGERLYGWPYHKWYVNWDKDKGNLLLRRKTPECQSQFGRLFHYLAANDKLYASFHQQNPGLFLVRYEWEGKIDYEVLPSDESPLELGSDEAVEAFLARIGYGTKLSVKDRIKNLLPPSAIRLIKAVIVKGRR
jgi:SAM-dependent methyltransferase